jgi:hypothetical protein
MADSEAIDIQIVGCVEDAIEKLQINGQIMPLTYEMKQNAKEVTFLIRAVSRTLNSRVIVNFEISTRFWQIRCMTLKKIKPRWRPSSARLWDKMSQ